MEKRASQRIAGVSEISLLSPRDELITRASIMDMSEGGVLVAYLQKAEMNLLSTGQKLKFRFVVPTGEVQGRAEVVRVDPATAQIALRLLAIENEEGVSHLLGFLHSWFCGVD